jgi:hypothetical protein
MRLVADGFYHCPVRATWAAFQINLVKVVGFCLGYDIFAHMSENKPVLEFRNLLGNCVMQYCASFRMANCS